MSSTPPREKAYRDGYDHPGTAPGATPRSRARFAAGLAGAGLLAKALQHDPEEHRPIDLLALGVATFKAAQTISHDEVASFIRDPFVEGDAHEGGEDAVETGDLRQAIGELVTCSRCAASGRGEVERRLS
jgi:hypothetical protein